MAGSTTETENYAEIPPGEPVDIPVDTREEQPEETTRHLADGSRRS